MRSLDCNQIRIWDTRYSQSMRGKIKSIHALAAFSEHLTTKIPNKKDPLRVVDRGEREGGYVHSLSALRASSFEYSLGRDAPTDRRDGKRKILADACPAVYVRSPCLQWNLLHVSMAPWNNRISLSNRKADTQFVNLQSLGNTYTGWPIYSRTRLF